MYRPFYHDNRKLSTFPGKKGPFDSQSISEAAKGSKNRINCLRLYQIASMFGSPNILELGTNLGVSTSFLSIGAKNQPDFTNTRVLTIDISEIRIAIAKNVHKNLELNNVDYFVGDFSNVLPRILPAKFGMCFIDGDHTYEGTIDYFNLLKSNMVIGGVIIFDDITWSTGMKKAWNKIEQMQGNKKNIFQIDGMGYLQILN